MQTHDALQSTCYRQLQRRLVTACELFRDGWKLRLGVYGPNRVDDVLSTSFFEMDPSGLVHFLSRREIIAFGDLGVPGIATVQSSA